jgi:hypothetical protein
MQQRLQEALLHNHYDYLLENNEHPKEKTSSSHQRIAATDLGL